MSARILFFVLFLLAFVCATPVVAADLDSCTSQSPMKRCSLLCGAHVAAGGDTCGPLNSTTYRHHYIELISNTSCADGTVTIYHAGDSAATNRALVGVLTNPGDQVVTTIPPNAYLWAVITDETSCTDVTVRVQARD